MSFIISLRTIAATFLTYGMSSWETAVKRLKILKTVILPHKFLLILRGYVRVKRRNQLSACKLRCVTLCIIHKSLYHVNQMRLNVLDLDGRQDLLDTLRCLWSLSL
jgi:hypothetical protein